MKKKILFVNNLNENCGVFQYGRRTYDILKNSKNYDFSYLGVSSWKDFDTHVKLLLAPPFSIWAIIYNYHPSTLPWVNKDMLSSLKDIKHYGIHHEGVMPNIFYYNILTDSTAYCCDITNFSVPRPLIEGVKTIDYGEPQFPIIGSFGFGFYNKGFERLVKMVNDEFERATIRLNIPFSYYGDADGFLAKDIAAKCAALVNHSKTNLVITHNFMKESVLLNFLGSNTINCFLYDNASEGGVSSCIDYALSVDVPIAISDSGMFRHLDGALISTNRNTLKGIIGRGMAPLMEYRERWSNKNFIARYEYVLDATL